jgi:hypothetical protein
MSQNYSEALRYVRFANPAGADAAGAVDSGGRRVKIRVMSDSSTVGGTRRRETGTRTNRMLCVSYRTTNRVGSAGGDTAPAAAAEA